MSPKLHFCFPIFRNGESLIFWEDLIIVSFIRFDHAGLLDHTLAGIYRGKIYFLSLVCMLLMRPNFQKHLFHGSNTYAVVSQSKLCQAGIQLREEILELWHACLWYRYSYFIGHFRSDG